MSAQKSYSVLCRVFIVAKTISKVPKIRSTQNTSKTSIENLVEHFTTKNTQQDFKTRCHDLIR